MTRHVICKDRASELQVKSRVIEDQSVPDNDNQFHQRREVVGFLPRPQDQSLIGIS